MARKCSACGSADTSTGLHEFTCLSCGATSPIVAPEPRGRIPNPDGPAHYAGDDGATFHGDPPKPAAEEPKKKASAKAS